MDQSDGDFKLLRAFVDVADCGGFHRAAERPNLTQSTVNQVQGLLRPAAADQISI
jgi:DNA-binding transcriptional LysR family regulator